MPDTSARRAYVWSVRALYVLAPGTVLALLVYLYGWLPAPHGRVLFQSLVMALCSATVMAVVSAGQLAIARAFRAGYMTGQEAAKGERAHATAKHLRMVPTERAE